MVLSRCLCALALASLAQGCVSVLPEQAVPSGLYRLNDVDGDAMLVADLVVREPTAARIFASEGMVFQADDGALRLISGVEWAGRPAQLLKDGLIDALDGDGPGTAVSDLTGGRGAFELSWRIRDLTIVETPSVEEAVCRLSLTLLDGETRDPVARRSVERRVDVTVTSAAGRASALSEAATACVSAAADFLVVEIRLAHSAGDVPVEAAGDPDD